MCIRLLLLGLVCLAIVAGIGASSAATPELQEGTEVKNVPSGPYRSIVERNIFNLKTQTIESTPPVQPQPPQKITLTGITTILGSKVALLRVAIPPKPPEGAKEESYMLTEGQGAGGIEVISIDEMSGVVKVNNRGVPQTVDFVNNGSKLTAAAGVPALSSPAGLPGHSVNGAIPAPPGQTANAGRIIRPIRTGPGTQSGTPEGVAQEGNSRVYTSAPPPPVLSREEQVIAIEVERVRLQNENDPTAVLLPPTELTPE